DDGSTGNGSFYIVDVDTREEAQAFIDGDPFTAGGLFERIVIQRWRKAYLDGKSYL
ncbi:MAG TPA: YciI family protein, partial [Burkholderiaceae bacterium]|nr:YciI family protein [Burkholderiaceae bacterium]